MGNDIQLFFCLSPLLCLVMLLWSQPHLPLVGWLGSPPRGPGLTRVTLKVWRLSIWPLFWWQASRDWHLL